jgi:hypothetical protein
MLSDEEWKLEVMNYMFSLNDWKKDRRPNKRRTPNSLLRLSGEAYG